MKAYRTLVSHAIALGGSVLVGGCAHVTFHPQQQRADLPDTSIQTGVKYYNTKPYLLVSYTGSKDTPVSVSQINLPDLEHPVYAIYHPGLGSHQLAVSLSPNGTLSSYGQTVDSKIPELLTAIGSAGSSLATSAKQVATQTAEENPAKSQVIKAIGQLKVITVDMNQSSDLVKTVHAPITDAISTLNRVVAEMDSGKYDQIDRLKGVRKALPNVPDAQGTQEAVTINSAVNTAKAALQEAVTALEKQSGSNTPAKADFLLFEIKSVNGVTTLVPVKVPTP